jgi:hypothetical protein
VPNDATITLDADNYSLDRINKNYATTTSSYTYGNLYQKVESYILKLNEDSEITITSRGAGSINSACFNMIQIFSIS